LARLGVGWLKDGAMVGVNEFGACGGGRLGEIGPGEGQIADALERAWRIPSSVEDQYLRMAVARSSADGPGSGTLKSAAPW
jgi:hypothetical protein